LTYQSATAQQAFYDPQKGFKPAQSDLSATMLQLAGSLEHHGSPEPYIRHVMAEHKRIDALYAKITGDTKSSARPGWFTDKKLELLIKNWKELEKPLQLQALCRECGVDMRHAIRGSWRKTHAELVEEESKLDKREKAMYLKLLQKEFFKKSDKKEIDQFYVDGGGWDKLSPTGKDQIGMRLELGMKTAKERESFKKLMNGNLAISQLFLDYQLKYFKDPEKKINSSLLESMLIKKLKLNEDKVDYKKFGWKDKDAIRYSHYIQDAFQRRFDLVDKKLSPSGAKSVKIRMMSMVDSLRIAAHSEMLAGFREARMKRNIKQKN